MIVLHVKYTDRYTYVYKHVARLFQPCMNHLLIYNLVTTLLQPSKRLVGVTNLGFGQPSGKVVTTLYQPCTNHVTTLFQPCHYLVARLLQGCYKLATMLSIHGIKMAVLPCDKVVTT